MVFLNLILASLLILAVIGVRGYWKWRTEQTKLNTRPLYRLVQNNEPPTHQELLMMAHNAGYWSETNPNGTWSIYDPQTGEKMTERKLLAKVQK